MEYGEELFFHVKEIVKWGTELGRKIRSAVIDDGVSKAVMLYHYIDNYFRHSRSFDGNFDWFIMHYFCKSINND